jgi:hypothetical protein
LGKNQRKKLDKSAKEVRIQEGRRFHWDDIMNTGFTAFLYWSLKNIK